MEESSNFMSCMAYGYMDMGKPSLKNGRKEGKTQDFGMGQIMAMFSALVTPKRWWSKGYFVPEEPKTAGLQGGPWAEFFFTED